MQAASGAAGHQDLGLGVVGQAVVALLLQGDGLAQALNSVQAGIDVLPGADGADRLLFHRRGHWRVADALGEVDAAHAVAFGGHGADFGLHHARRQFAECQARRSGRRARLGGYRNGWRVKGFDGCGCVGHGEASSNQYFTGRATEAVGPLAACARLESP